MKNITSYDLRAYPASKLRSARVAKRAQFCCLLAVLCFGSFWSSMRTVYAAGGGENILLIVNPSDEPSLRIANAYVNARNIPTNNILYIDPTNGKGVPIYLSEASFTSLYQVPILAAITARGLTNQIDYIGTIGQPTTISASYLSGSTSKSYMISFHDCLNHLTQFQNGMTMRSVIGRKSELLQNPPSSLPQYSYTPGSNAAIYHSQQLVPLSGTLSSVQWYMSGMIGYSGVRGLTTTQVIQNLQRTVKGDGSNPLGTVYFEYSDGTRGAPRSPNWPAVQSYMDAIGIPWLRENGIATPKNRSDVRGAVTGDGTPYSNTQIVNGSAYLPGSWADNLTSAAGNYNENTQSKISGFLLGGAGGTAGAVEEPYATQSRFTYASIFLFSNDGSTLGEAFYKSISQPDLVMFQGDLLSQAYADVLEVNFNGGPTNGSTVSGIVSVSGSARLSNPRVATGISQMKLFVDGLQTGAVVSGSSGSFSLDTTALTDGVHEVRIVAYNNSHAASEGYTLKNLVVNNKGQSVRITGTNNYNIAWNQLLSLPVTVGQGTGATITGIQLQSLGRVVGSISGSNGNVSLSGTNLAYGSNTITPVAILSSSSQQVQGTPITVTRQFQQFPGKAPTPLANRNPGADFYYFGGVVSDGSTLDTINFTATPSYTLHSTSISINPGSMTAPGIRNMPDEYRRYGWEYAYQLAIMIKSNFTVSTAGEYLFSPSFGSYTKFGLFVDGAIVTRNDGTFVPQQSIYLLPGEHTLTVKLGQSRTGRTAYEGSFSVAFRGPDGNTISTSNFYTANRRLSP